MAVTITYLYPRTAAPSAGQTANMVIATVSASAAADTSAIITHAMSLAASEITQGFPRTVIVPQADQTTSPWFEASQNPNFTILQKSTAGAGGAVKVIIDEPNTIDR